MKNIKVKAPARVTLTLDIIKRLNNGYHELNSVKQEINLYDTIKIKKSDNLTINFDNPDLNNENTILKTVLMLKKRYGIGENVKIDVEKNIPAGAGLAGGSSDAASALIALNRLWKLNLDKEQLIDLAKEIGKDVPYFIFGKTCFDTENGFIKRIKSPPGMNLVVVYPYFEISSEYAYSNLDYRMIGKRLKSKEMIEAIDNQDIRKIAKYLHNDFEYSILKKYPQIKKIKDCLIDNNALNAVMTGSGSCIFGIFESKKKALEIKDSIKENMKNSNVFLSKTI